MNKPLPEECENRRAYLNNYSLWIIESCKYGSPLSRWILLYDNIRIDILTSEDRLRMVGYLSKPEPVNRETWGICKILISWLITDTDSWQNEMKDGET